VLHQRCTACTWSVLRAALLRRSRARTWLRVALLSSAPSRRTPPCCTALLCRDPRLLRSGPGRPTASAKPQCRLLGESEHRAQVRTCCDVTRASKAPERARVLFADDVSSCCQHFPLSRSRSSASMGCFLPSP
jgi:hypothetical protein